MEHGKIAAFQPSFSWADFSDVKLALAIGGGALVLGVGFMVSARREPNAKD